jgi:hypothetical protein
MKEFGRARLPHGRVAGAKGFVFTWLMTSPGRYIGRAVVYRVTPGSARLSAWLADWFRFVRIFFGALLGPSGASPYQLLLNVFTCINCKGNNERLLFTGRSAPEINQHFKRRAG